MRKFWLTLRDARLRAAVMTAELAGPALGDLAAAPAAAPSLFRSLRTELAAALKAGPAESLAAASAAEDFAARLEKTFSDMALLGVPPDAAVMEALGLLQRACAEAPALLTPRGRKAASERLRALCASGRKTLALARASADGAGFPQNLKFSSIYSGLDAAFDALERCGEALFKA